MTTQVTPQASRTIDGAELPAPGTYEIDASHTHVGFVVRHLMVSKTRGNFPVVSGTIVIGHDQLDSSVEVSIDTASVDTGDEKRDGHLRSADFFDVEKYPALRFRSTRVEDLGEGRLRVTGELTIRDVTREVVLDAEQAGTGKDPWGNERVGFNAPERDDFKFPGPHLHWDVSVKTPSSMGTTMP